ncbi:MAG: hypothetical protein IPN20_25760 [Haliscomenobacter sp.]|nr:hypothetical protein [Haliscomenobacter sp.]
MPGLHLGEQYADSSAGWYRQLMMFKRKRYRYQRAVTLNVVGQQVIASAANFSLRTASAAVLGSKSAASMADESTIRREPG